MAEAGIPTAASFTCGTPGQADQALAAFGPPYVVKDDALAAGKGVLVTTDLDAARAHAGACGTVVIEEFLDGPEVSLFAVTDGVTAVPLKPAQDFKRARDGDQGPNTGGMGAYAPLPWAPADLAEQAMAQVILPAVDTMRRRGTPYQGPALRRAQPDPGRLAGGGVQRQVRRPGDAGGAGPARQPARAAAGRRRGRGPGRRGSPGMAPGRGRGGGDRRGRLSRGSGQGGRDHRDRTARGSDHAYLLHAGTARDAKGALVTAGGRVLNAVGSGPDVATARARGLRARRTVVDAGRLVPPGHSGTPVTDDVVARDEDAPLRVSTLELFFDLVFVFAITQLTGILSHEVSVEDGFRVLLVFGALWWMYGGYVWLANARTPSRTTERLLMLAGMAGFLIMALAIPDAFGRDGVALGIGYLIVVVVHGWLYQRVNRNIARVAPFNLVAALLVITAGVVGGDGRLRAVGGRARRPGAVAVRRSRSAGGSPSSPRTSPSGTARWSSSCSASRWWTSGSAPRGTR